MEVNYKESLDLIIDCMAGKDGGNSLKKLRKFLAVLQKEADNDSAAAKNLY